MDLTIPINGIKLNIRVTVLVETPKGFIFEKDKSGFFFPVGGRIKINESSIDAAKREIKEELGIEIEEPTYIATLENFFHYEGKPFHEISIIYQAKIEEFDCPNGFYAFDSERMKNLDIKPAAINEIISNKSSGIKHFIIRENEKGTGHPCPTLLKTGAN
jgi:8-oxo-dGTP pyrophosphatase MutT (NUDIX family)